MKRLLRLALLATIIVLAAACSGDVISIDWREPTHDGQQTNDGSAPDEGKPDVPQQPAPLPSLEITTAGGAAIESKRESADAVFRLTTPGSQTEARGRIRGRGNATWTYEKKPYKIKLDESLSLYTAKASARAVSSA